MIRTRAAALASFLCTCSFAGALAATTPGEGCTEDLFETNAAAVIEPCTDRIGVPGIATEDRAAAFYLRARGYQRTGRIELAAQDFDVAIKLSPKHAEYYAHRANTEFKRELNGAAFADLTQALALDPKNAVANRMLGYAYQVSGYTDKALEFYAQALSTDPAEPYTLQQRSQLFAGLHRFDEALADANALVAIPTATINRLGYVIGAKLQDFHVVALTNRAEILLSIGRTEDAQKDFDAAVAQKWSPEALVPRGQYLLSKNQEEAALKDFEESVRLDPTLFDAQNGRGMALLGLKRFDDALEAFGLASKLRPDDGWSLLMHARMYRELGRTEEAVHDLEHAIEIDPRVKAQVRYSYAAAGYLSDPGTLATATQLHAAAQACMIDPTCN